MTSFASRLLARWRRRDPERREQAGYSLLEVLIVLTIIALIAALVGPRLMSQLDRSKVKTAQVQMRTLAASLETMRIDLGRYPTNDEGLGLLVHPPAGDDSARWQGPYLDSEVPADPWGGQYAYQAPQADFQRPNIKSFGSDGAEGGSGLAADIAYGDTP